MNFITNNPAAGASRNGVGNVINLNRYKQSTSAQTTKQAPFAEKVAEEAWLKSKREYLENPNDANFWAMGILERAFLLMYGGSE